MVEGWLVGQLQPSLQHCSSLDQYCTWKHCSSHTHCSTSHCTLSDVMGIQSDENTYYSVGCVSVSA